MKTYLMPHPPILLPEIGDATCDKTFEACQLIGDEIRSSDVNTIIIITPHGPVFRDAIAVSTNDLSGNLGQFGAPDVKMTLEIDQELTRLILEEARRQKIETVELNEETVDQFGLTYELDHGSIIPLYFVGTDYKFVHITYGLLDKFDLYRFGMIIKNMAAHLHRKATLIASGDLSHCLSKEGPYGYSQYGELFDEAMTQLLKNGDAHGIVSMDDKMVYGAKECGYRSILMMLGAMDHPFKGELLSYECPFGVGYAVMSFFKTGETSVYDSLFMSEKLPTRLARESLYHYLTHGHFMSCPAYADPLTHQKNGAFVSIKKHGQLRGCIGTIQPTKKNLAEEILRNAVAAGINDPRFPAITLSEFPSLSFSVDVLSEPKKATKEQLNPRKYGVIVFDDYRSGVLLPDLDGIDTIDDQIGIALRKAGISGDYQIERFEVKRYVE